MIKKIFIILLLIITVIVIKYIDNGIRTHDMTFYQSKDNGYTIRFESIVILNTLFYSLMAIQPKRKLLGYLKHVIAGFGISVFWGIFCYFLFLSFDDNYGLTYHVVTIIISYSSYFGIKRWKETTPWTFRGQG
ncbi:MAG: hypothetical protein NVV82_26740 [Sporocytophaga sp.]|nr:hypothetical protein [Sporocytophaga sp.]